MHRCTPQHNTRVHQSHVYMLHLLMVLLERQARGASLRSSLTSLFLLTAVLGDTTISTTHVVLVLTALLQRGNGV